MICLACGRNNREGARFCDECGANLVSVDDHQLIPESLTDSSTGLVGRQQEMQELLSALEDASAGRGRLVMLAGEPGIGKTRLAKELEKHSIGQDFQVLWGRCYEGQGAPPYWPWVQALRELIGQASPDQLQSYMGPNASHIAELIPELRTKLANLQPSPDLEPEQARFRLFDAVTTFLKNCAQSRPIVVILDDLHWANRSSLLLLEFLVREIGRSRLLVAGAYRDMELSRRHPLAETLGDLTRQRLSQRILLRGLAPGDIARLVENAAEITPSPELVRAVHTQTEGNPLFVTEVARLLSQEGVLNGENQRENETWNVRIPEGVREVIGRRLNRLSPQCNETLTFAAVIGREFALDQLRLLLETQTDEGLLDLLEEAEAARVIEEVPHLAGRFRFTHALIQDTLYEELPTTRRVRLHAWVAQVLENLQGGTIRAHAAELAHHFAEAEAMTGAEKLSRYSLMAGESALGARAYEEALAHFQRGLKSRGVSETGEEPASDEETAALLSGFAQAQYGTKDRLSYSQVEAVLTRAFDFYLAIGDTTKAVEIPAYHLPINVGSQMIQRALELVPPDSHVAGMLSACHITSLRAEYQRAEEAFFKALSIARLEKNPALEMRALVAQACVDFTNCRFQQSSERNLQAVALAGQANLPTEESHARYDLTHVQLAMGNLSEASIHAEALSGPAERSGVSIWRARAMEIRENICSARGDWQAAREFSEKGLAVLPRDPVMLGCRALIEYQTGDFDAGEEYITRILEVYSQGQIEASSYPSTYISFYTVPAIVIGVAGRITGVIKRVDFVQSLARSVLASPFAHPGPVNAAQIGSAFIAAQQGDASAAKELYGGLGTIAGTIQPQCPLGPGVSGDRVLGLLASTAGSLHQAESHFEDALAFCRNAGYRPELAWTCCDYADTLLERNQSGDRVRASSLLEESLAISTELGMPPLMQRVKTRLEGMDSLVPAELAYPHGLSLREVEVLRLVAQGKSNRDIGKVLVISEGTVRRHVSNIFDKIGVANRTEASRYATQQGLVSSD